MNPLHLEIKKQLGSINPIVILKQWLNMSLKKSGLKQPWAMLLSTSKKNQVDSRVVLLKKIHKSNLMFYTNYLSSKAQDMQANPQVACNFYWPKLNRQIRIQGTVKKGSQRQSVLYWNSRPRSSQLSQWVSQQSQKLQSKQQLLNLKKQAEIQFKNKSIPCPLHWGAYVLSIHKIEFWLDQAYRLHDRFVFKKSKKTWKIQRLFP